MENVIIVLIVLALFAGSMAYIIRTKKKGNKCIGCPDSCADCSACSKCGKK